MAPGRLNAEMQVNMMEIAPGIFCLPMDSVNVYLCVDRDGLVLIDAAMPKNKDKIWAAIQQVGHDPQRLNRLIITHADIDHAGSAAAIQSATQATVYAGLDTAQHLHQGTMPKHMPWLADLISSWFMRLDVVSELVKMKDGDELPVAGGLRVLATPGHTLDHMSLYHPATGVLFAGDALNTRKSRVQITPKVITADVAAANRSALRLLNLQPEVIACGHGQPLNRKQSDWSPLLHQLQNQ